MKKYWQKKRLNLGGGYSEVLYVKEYTVDGFIDNIFIKL